MYMYIYIYIFTYTHDVLRLGLYMLPVASNESVRRYRDYYQELSIHYDTGAGVKYFQFFVTLNSYKLLKSMKIEFV